MKFYELTYYNLVNSARLRGLDKAKLEGYYECHHILPRSLGGSDLPDNLVLLTAREHFIAHYLLTRFTSGPARHKMLYALAIIGKSQRLNRKLTARQYAICKKANSEVTSARNKYQIEAGTHPWQTDEYRKAQSEQVSARNKSSMEAGTHPWQSDEFKLAQSERVSAELKAKAEAGTHPWQSPEGRLRSSTHLAKVSRVKMTCKHCGKSTSPGLFARYHGDKCKLLTEIGSHCLLTDKPANWVTCPIDGCDYGCLRQFELAKHIKKYHN